MVIVPSQRLPVFGSALRLRGRRVDEGDANVWGSRYAHTLSRLHEPQRCGWFVISLIDLLPNTASLVDLNFI